MPLTAKHPAVMLNPTFDVEVAEPEMFKPERVVVPKPVDETDRNEVFVVPAALVDEATEKSAVFVLPNGLNTPRDAVGVVEPMPRLPAK